MARIVRHRSMKEGGKERNRERKKERKKELHMKKAFGKKFVGA